MSVKQKFMNLLNYATNNQIDGTFMTRLQPLHLEQQSYNDSADGTPDDIIALFGMNAIESSSDLCRRIIAINSPAARTKIAIHVWRILNGATV